MGSPVLRERRGGAPREEKDCRTLPAERAGRENSGSAEVVSCRDRGGFTLLETVIAMGVMGFVFLSLPGLLLVLEQIEHDTSLRAGALFCVQEKLEELKSHAALGTLKTGEHEEVLSAGPYERMRRSWEVRAVHGSPGLHHVSAVCSCSRKGAPIRQEIETLMVVAE